MLVLGFFVCFLVCLVFYPIAPEYDIVYPEYVIGDETNSISIDAIAEDSLNINIAAFGNHLKLVVHQDTSLFSDGFYAEKIQENGQPMPLSVRTDCFHTGEMESEPDSMVSLSTCSGLVSKKKHASKLGGSRLVR